MGGIYHDGDYYAGSDTNDRAPKSIITNDTAYNPSKSYVSGDWFIDGDVLYEVKIACQGITPPNDTYYNPITLHELKNRIDALNSDLAIQSGSVTYVPDKSISASIALVKSGNVGSLTISNGSFTASVGEAFAVIPEGFRPNWTVDYLDTFSKYRLQISPNGEMSSMTALTNTVLRGSVTYITNH